MHGLTTQLNIIYRGTVTEILLCPGHFCDKSNAWYPNSYAKCSCWIAKKTISWEQTIFYTGWCCNVITALLNEFFDLGPYTHFNNVFYFNNVLFKVGTIEEIDDHQKQVSISYKTKIVPILLLSVYKMIGLLHLLQWSMILVSWTAKHHVC